MYVLLRAPRATRFLGIGPKRGQAKLGLIVSCVFEEHTQRDYAGMGLVAESSSKLSLPSRARFGLW